jgi:hypothetical protein
MRDIELIFFLFFAKQKIPLSNRNLFFHKIEVNVFPKKFDSIFVFSLSSLSRIF